jgi:hypothetical protein
MLSECDNTQVITKRSRKLCCWSPVLITTPTRTTYQQINAFLAHFYAVLTTLNLPGKPSTFVQSVFLLIFNIQALSKTCGKIGLGLGLDLTPFSSVDTYQTTWRYTPEHRTADCACSQSRETHIPQNLYVLVYTRCELYVEPISPLTIFLPYQDTIRWRVAI